MARLPMTPEEVAAAYDAAEAAGGHRGLRHRAGGACTCTGWHELGFCGKRAEASDAPEFLHRISVDDVRCELTGFDRAYNRLAPSGPPRRAP